MTANAKPQDALALLKEDHANVKALFQQFDELGERAYAAKKKLADRICLELTRHAIAEEEIFYPAVRDAADDSEDIIDEAIVEHASAKELIAQIADMEASDELFDAKVKVLSEQIEHHVKEEEKEMFAKAKQAGLDLLALGEEIAERKKEVGMDMIQPPQGSAGQAGDAARA
jgi:hemerythrin superfamily protein